MGLLIIGLFTLALGGIMWAAIWGTNKAMARLVGARHRALQAIMETGQVPLDWSRPFQAKIARLGQDPTNTGKVARLRVEASRQYLRKLDDLLRYAEKTPLVDSEETRNLLLDKLTNLRHAVQTRLGDEA